MSRFTSRRMVALFAALASALVLIGWTQNWATLQLDLTQVRQAKLELNGQSATVLPAGLALVGLALALLMLTAGPVLGYIFGSILALCGIGATSVVVGFAVSPASYAYKQLSTMSGIATDSVLATFVKSYALGFGLFLTGLGAIVLLLAGVFALLGARSYKRARSKYERQAVRDDARHTRAANGDAIDAWDDITAGGDPTA